MGDHKKFHKRVKEARRRGKEGENVEVDPGGWYQRAAEKMKEASSWRTDGDGSSDSDAIQGNALAVTGEGVVDALDDADDGELLGEWGRAVESAVPHEV